MLGDADAIERTIMRFIYNNRNVVSYEKILIHIVYKNLFCTEQRLRHRLDSLVKFGYLNKFEVHGTIFYEIIFNENFREQVDTKKF
jgi:hypothetical protein